ncbi:MAG TPA: ABC transporter permease subunit [Chitinophagaceae bacterium]|nr:ABC transporter permease subunit [Chitinophagaceae bacterium]
MKPTFNIRNLWVVQLAGWIILFIIWYSVTNFGLINNHVMPTPQKTWGSFIEMQKGDDLVGNIFFSIRINLIGYFKCIIAALIVGFGIGLFPNVRKMFSQQVNALRFVPITALMGIFIAISGLTITTKINFLAFGIWVYLVPVVVQRIDEVNEVHLQMMKTLGANFWQTVRYVIWPSVIARLSDDIRILVGISWTYIIVAELAGIQGGLGSLIFLGERQSNVGKVYAVIFIIVAIGILQDALFRLIDNLLFRFKHQ